MQKKEHSNTQNYTVVYIPLATWSSAYYRKNLKFQNIYKMAAWLDLELRKSSHEFRWQLLLKTKKNAFLVFFVYFCWFDRNTKSQNDCLVLFLNPIHLLMNFTIYIPQKIILRKLMLNRSFKIWSTFRAKLL